MTNAPHGREVGPPVYDLSPGERLAKARRNAQLSPLDMAELLGVSDRTIRNYESDATPVRRSVFITYAWHTGYDLEWLRTGKMPTSPGDPSQSDQVISPTACNADARVIKFPSRLAVAA